MPQVQSVNVGAAAEKAYAKVSLTGIDKRAADGPVEVRAPGPKRGVSGVAGDYIGDARHHGGDRQAVYAFQREDLDRWQRELGRDAARTAASARTSPRSASTSPRSWWGSAGRWATPRAATSSSSR